MRGTPSLEQFSQNFAGIIPAYAGNTIQRPAGRMVERDHPRVCGEHSVRLAMVVSKVGSSPRMRGTRTGGCGDVEAHGIIPAYAGNTVHRFEPHVHERDHPRVCGEHAISKANPGQMVGSSPRMRGTPSLRKTDRPICGIIPAYAGNTRPALQRKSIARDHPRVCGEHWINARRNPKIMGSSPRMRGTH